MGNKSSDGPLKLCGFTDEIDADLDVQIEVAKACGLSGVELRSVGGVNVLAFAEHDRAEYKRKLDDAGLKVISIGSPCGKRPATDDEADVLEQFKVAVDMAEFFGAPLIRVFSFYPDGGEGAGPVEAIEDRAVELLCEQARLLAGTDVTMVHENEKGIFGDTGDRCVTLMERVNSPRLRSAFDFANFVQCDEDPADNWPRLKDFTTHIHIKDAKRGTGEVVKPGDGDGHLGDILKDAHAGGYRGYVSMEPHLKVAGHSHGESGPELFTAAVAALRKVCDGVGVPLEDASK